MHELPPPKRLATLPAHPCCWHRCPVLPHTLQRVAAGQGCQEQRPNTRPHSCTSPCPDAPTVTGLVRQQCPAIPSPPAGAGPICCGSEHPSRAGATDRNGHVGGPGRRVRLAAGPCQASLSLAPGRGCGSHGPHAASRVQVQSSGLSPTFRSAARSGALGTVTWTLTARAGPPSLCRGNFPATLSKQVVQAQGEGSPPAPSFLLRHSWAGGGARNQH